MSIVRWAQGTSGTTPGSPSTLPDAQECAAPVGRTPAGERLATLLVAIAISHLRPRRPLESQIPIGIGAEVDEKTSVFFELGH